MNKLLPKSLIKNKKPYCELCSKDLTRAKMPCWCDDCRVCIESYLQELGQEQWIQEGYAKGKADTLEAVDNFFYEKRRLLEKAEQFNPNARILIDNIQLWQKELKSEAKEKGDENG